MQVDEKAVVLIHYTLKNSEGDVLDSSEGRDPLGYIHGLGNIIPGLEKALSGKAVGDKVNAVIPPEEAYGLRDEKLVQTVPLDQFDQKDQVKVGVQFQANTPEGARIATVINLEGENVTLDLNHPLANETLCFDVEIMNIREATNEELEHGHVHGPGGHQH